MKKLLLILSVLLHSQLAIGARIKGKINCQWEIVPIPGGTVVKGEPFEMDINSVAMKSFAFDELSNKIRFRYTPGRTPRKGITHFVMSLTYDQAHGGADIPLTKEPFTLKISRDQSDMIGGFLTCQASYR